MNYPDDEVEAPWEEGKDGVRAKRVSGHHQTSFGVLVPAASRLGAQLDPSPVRVVAYDEDLRPIRGPDPFTQAHREEDAAMTAARKGDASPKGKGPERPASRSGIVEFVHRDGELRIRCREVLKNDVLLVLVTDPEGEIYRPRAEQLQIRIPSSGVVFKCINPRLEFEYEGNLFQLFFISEEQALS